MPAQLTRYKFTVEEYEKMGEAGIFHEGQALELLEGEIIEMTPIGSPHAACVKRLIRLFSTHIGLRAQLGAQDPIRMDDRSEPQPDLALLKPRPDFYARRHPRPEDVLLLVEVAASSLELDRMIKAPLYARAGIIELWIADVEGGCVEVYREPSAEGYKSVRVCQRGEGVRPVSFPDVELPVLDMLGPAELPPEP